MFGHRLLAESKARCISTVALDTKTKPRMGQRVHAARRRILPTDIQPTRDQEEIKLRSSRGVRTVVAFCSKAGVPKGVCSISILKISTIKNTLPLESNKVPGVQPKLLARQAF